MPDSKAAESNFIDGKLGKASDQGTFENINPATEEVIGSTADGTRDDMNRAIAAARRAFDETDWSTDHAFRKHCLEQFNAALAESRDELREIVVAEAGSHHLSGTGRQLYRLDALLVGSGRKLPL